MDKEINRIRINKLRSENNIFDEIIFQDGVNIILGEKYDNSIVRGRKTNGVGKSMCIEMIDFCFLSDYDKSRISRIPYDILPLEENIILELDIGDKQITIKRNRKSHDKPLIYKDDKCVYFEKLQDARDYLSELIFIKLGGDEVPSFRNLLSLLMRDEGSEFTDILICHNLKKRVPADLTTHLFLLGISVESYKRTIKTIKEIESITTVINKNKNELTNGGTKRITDVKAELNSLDDELGKMEEAIESFKSNETFDSMENDLLELESILEQLRNKQKALRYEYNKIKDMPKPEAIDDNEIELVYNQFKNDLGTVIVKSLNEVVTFKNKVEEFQRMIINQKAKELEAQLMDIAERIRIIDDEYAEKLKIIDQKGVLKNLKASLKIYENKKDSYANIKLLYKQYESNEKTKKILKLRKTQELMEIDNQIEEKKELLDSFMQTISEIHEFIMGNKECSFNIQTIDNAKSKTPIDISMRIYDDGSHSVDRTKVFIYDIALLFNEFTRLRHPLLLIHDNIFDVDQDTLVQSLNYLARQEEKFQDFQYILTLNRDKIENEEKLKLIKLDIDTHRRASFTKNSKFLKKNYQEK